MRDRAGTQASEFETTMRTADLDAMRRAVGVEMFGDGSDVGARLNTRETIAASLKRAASASGRRPVGTVSPRGSLRLCSSLRRV
jgi:hypothetical protein